MTDFYYLGQKIPPGKKIAVAHTEREIKTRVVDEYAIIQLEQPTSSGDLYFLVDVADEVVAIMDKESDEDQTFFIKQWLLPLRHGELKHIFSLSTS